MARLNLAIEHRPFLPCAGAYVRRAERATKRHVNFASEPQQKSEGRDVQGEANEHS